MQMAISLRVMCLFQSVGAVQNNQSLIISRAAMLDNTNVSSLTMGQFDLDLRNLKVLGNQGPGIREWWWIPPEWVIGSLPKKPVTVRGPERRLVRCFNGNLPNNAFGMAGTRAKPITTSPHWTSSSNRWVWVLVREQGPFTYRSTCNRRSQQSRSGQRTTTIRKSASGSMICLTKRGKRRKCAEPKLDICHCIYS